MTDHTPDVSALLPERIAELAKKAWTTPWRVGRQTDAPADHIIDFGEPPKSPYLRLHNGSPLISARPFGIAETDEETDDDARAATTALIVELGNNVPAIVAALTRATPTPADQGDLVERVSNAVDEVMDQHDGFDTYDIARAAIAVMPAVGEVAELRGALSAFRAICDHRNQQNDDLRTQLAERDKTIAGMREALEFYGDKAGWNEPPVKTHQGIISIEYENQASKIRRDRGRIARQALTPQVPHG